MISFHTDFLQSLGWAALNSLWQMALLWLIFQMLITVFKVNASYKSGIASSLLIAGFCWFIYTFITSFNSAADITTFSSGILNVNGDQQVNNLFLQFLPIASIVYLSLLIFPILRFIRNYRYVQIIRQYGLSKINIDSKLFIKKTASILGIKRKVQVWVSELVSSPVTIGFLKPVILVPLAAINQLTPQQFEAVLLHELTHIKRFDYIINLLINFIQTILYFNPFVKAFIKITETEREKSCDEMVMQFQYNSHEYASALLELEKVNHSQQLLALSAAGNKNDLLHRIENILNVQKKSIVNVRKIIGLAFTFCFIISINILFLFSQQFSSGNIAASNDAIFGVSKYLVPENEQAPKTPAEINKSTIINAPDIVNAEFSAAAIANEIFAKDFASTIVPPGLINVSFNLAQAPELKQYQEEQIKQALEASKKVLENNQWKVVENNIAEVFSQKEKEELKISYLQELNKFDWNKWENRLRNVYNNVNWDKVNDQLNMAISQIRLDSLQNVYANVAMKLNEVQKELAAKKIQAIPDTDISLETILANKQKVQHILNELKAVKTKKIVRL
ncbi:MAG: M56 family metallopeptidase [Chitinophagaceae bacterium]